MSFSLGGVLARVRGLRLAVVFRSAARCALSGDFVRGAALLDFGAARFAFAGLAGLIVLFDWGDSSPGVAEAAAGDIGSVTLFRLFSIYFSFSSASLYARKKTAQAEISMDEALAE